MRFFAFLFCVPLLAAEPDWPAVERHALDLLQRYVRMATVDPPANTAAAAALIKAELEAAGFTPKLYTSGPDGQTNLIVRLPGRDRTKKPLLLLNHFDVVPVDAKAWGGIDPFGAEIKDGIIWGRGTLDMKGLGVEQMTALIEMKKAGTVPPRDIVMLCTADEEAGGKMGIQWMLKNHFDEIDPAYVLDEGGVGSRDLFAAGKLIFGVSVGEKQMFWLKLRAKGTAGHGSQPIADNANLILLDAIRKAMDMAAGDKLNPVVGQMTQASGGRFAENKFTHAIQGNTISLTTLQSGVGSPVKPNVIPSVAEATLDCRLLPGVNADEFESGIKARINDRRVTVERLSDPVDAGVSSAETPLFAAMRKALLKEHPDAVVTPMLTPYGTDSVHLRKRGIPAYGFIPMTLDTATVATMHSDQERIPVAEFLRGIRIYFDVLRSEY
ncbi:MAG TPA: M20/M25/M40 family metallo-hydrolase [Bryobacteraceae bacterium]|nr:M20/M25/M40 family metallo-hydrolase [Bryobacteraceae bacterium]